MVVNGNLFRSVLINLYGIAIGIGVLELALIDDIYETGCLFTGRVRLLIFC